MTKYENKSSTCIRDDKYLFSYNSTIYLSVLYMKKTWNLKSNHGWSHM